MHRIPFVGLFVFGARALDNGAAETPPMGWSSWNRFSRKFNETVFYQHADVMVKNGMKAAGYQYINVDGGWWAGVDTGTIIRNSSGFMDYDHAKYPNGIESLVEYIHGHGFLYGHYTDAGTSACNGDKPMSQGYEHQDAQLFAQWGLDMLKIDGCGIRNETLHKVNMDTWRRELNATGRRVVLSNCHNGCGSTFSGPTLALAECNPSDPAQQWFVLNTSTKSVGTRLSDSLYGLCGDKQVSGPLDANGTSTGMGLRTCMSGMRKGPLQHGQAIGGLDQSTQMWVLDQTGEVQLGALTSADGQHGQASGQKCLEATSKGIVNLANCAGKVSSNQQWTQPLGAGAAPEHAPIKNANGQCLTSRGQQVKPDRDPWCMESNNMWRVSTDILCTWYRVLLNLESMIGQGSFAGPGHWNDPDFLEVGNGDLTLDENRAHMALWAITSAPLIAGNDLRSMTPDVLEILINPRAIAVNQQYAGNGGDRIFVQGPSEVWYKPLPQGTAAVVFLNRRDDDVALKISVPLEDLPVLGKTQTQRKCYATDVWTGARTIISGNVYSSTVKMHAVDFVTITCEDVGMELLV